MAVRLAPATFHSAGSAGGLHLHAIGSHLEDDVALGSRSARGLILRGRAAGHISWDLHPAASRIRPAARQSASTYSSPMSARTSR
eukprot:7712153-Heterocapsa_arctica.AAC.1